MAWLRVEMIDATPISSIPSAKSQFDPSELLHSNWILLELLLLRQVPLELRVFGQIPCCRIVCAYVVATMGG